MDEKRFGVGIIGAGHIVDRHLSAYRSLSELARVVAVADIDVKRAEEGRKRARADHAFDDYRKLIDCPDVEVVDICTPANFHARMTAEAIQAGKHVLCEKPLATTPADADAVVRAAQNRPNVTVGCVFQLRCEAAHRRTRALIEGGEIGRPLVASLTVRLRKKAAYFKSDAGRGTWKVDGGGVLINQAIHQLDALISFLGDPVEASAVMDTFVQGTETEDTIAGWVRFASGAFATLECTTCAHSKAFVIDVLGENAAVRIAGDPDAKAFDWQVKAPSVTARKALMAVGSKAAPTPSDPSSLARAIQKVGAKLSGREWKAPAHWGHTPLIREVLLAARTGAPGPMPPREARKSLELACALYEAAITQRVVSLPLDSSSPVYSGVKMEKMNAAERPLEAVAG